MSNMIQIEHFAGEKEKNITNSGDYTISVTGKQAEGSISLTNEKCCIQA